MRGRSLASRLPGLAASALTALVLLGCVRYRTVIHQSAAVLAGLAAAVVLIVLLLALAGWTLSAARSPARMRQAGRRPVRRAVRTDSRPTEPFRRAEAADGRLADMRAALSGPDMCLRGCGRTAEPPSGPDDPRPSAVCAVCAGQLAEAARPYPPFPPADDNAPPSPDPAFDEFADAHQELQP
jgi:hypothetical protein